MLACSKSGDGDVMLEYSGIRLVMSGNCSEELSGERDDVETGDVMDEQSLQF